MCPVPGSQHFDADGTGSVSTRCSRNCGVQSGETWQWTAKPPAEDPDDPDGRDEDDPPTWAEQVRSIQDIFEYETCHDCGGDFHEHTIGPDPLGNAHAWCRPTQEDEEEPTSDAMRWRPPPGGPESAGDIATAAQFAAAADGLVDSLTAEFDDAAAGVVCTQRDSRRDHRMAASLGSLLPEPDATAVRRLIEPGEQLVQAAKDRLAAASELLARGRAVQEVAAKHAQLMGRAVGPFYGN
jgi:hypothetical protein